MKFWPPTPGKAGWPCFNSDLQAAFHEAVDDYLAICEQLGQAPDKPVSGKLMLRVPPEVHRAALIAAETSGISLNQWAAKARAAAAHHG